MRYLIGALCAFALLASHSETASAATVIYCGVVTPNSTTSGQGSGPRTFELRVPSGPGGGFPFSVPPEDPLPTIASYICGQFEQGVPTNALVAYVRPGEPGYVAQTGPAVPPGPVHQCGTFVSYRPPDSTRSGELVIGSTRYAAAWMGSTGPAGSTPHTFNQVIASGVTPGSQACLDGTVVFSQTEGPLLTDFTVAPVQVATVSPVATISAPPPTFTAAPATPTATALPQAGLFGLGLIWLVAGVGALALLGFVIARARRGPTRS